MRTPAFLLLAAIAACSEAARSLPAGGDAGPLEAALPDATPLAADSAGTDVTAEDAANDRKDARVCVDAAGGFQDVVIPEPDGGLGYPGAWSPLPGLPAACGLRMALDPSRSIPRINWKPCACERSGCAYFRAEWSPGERGYKLERRDRSPVWLAGKPYFTFQRGHVKALAFTGYLVTLESLDGDVRFAVGSHHPASPDCVMSMGFGSGGVAMTAAVYERDASTRPEWILWSNWSAPTHLEYFATSSTELGGTVNELKATPDRIYMQSLRGAAGGHTLAFDRTTHALQRAFQDPSLYSEGPAEVPDGVLFLGGHDDGDIYLFRRDGTVTLVAKAPSGRTLKEPFVDRSNGNALVWEEATRVAGPWAKDYVLWTSPYATRLADLKPRAVARIPGDDTGRAMAVNAGMALFKLDERTGLLVRLSDGRGWHIPTEPDHHLFTPLWVDDNYVWFITGSQYANNPDGILRIERSTLGPPTLPSGL